MVLNNKTFRVFVSSTFADLKEERNALQNHVFPKLRELCAQYGCKFQAIDLRWGISEEASLDQQTMKICLEEIERSQRISPKPNFIVLLGDRYGWQPLPYEIPFYEFERILDKVLKDEEKELLLWKEEQAEDKKGWYRKDLNAIPPVYCLQPRTGIYKKYENWIIVEQKLHSILLDAASKLDLSVNNFLKYHASATHQEIIDGVLKVDNAEEHVFGFFREIIDLDEVKLEAQHPPQEIPKEEFQKMIMPLKNDKKCLLKKYYHLENKKYVLKLEKPKFAENEYYELENEIYSEIKNIVLNSNLDDEIKEKYFVSDFVDIIKKYEMDDTVTVYNVFDDEAHDKLHNLKNTLINYLPNNIFEYKIGWKNKKTKKKYLNLLCDDVYNSLSKIIKNELTKMENVEELYKEVKDHQAFGEDRTKNFIGRVEILRNIQKYLENSENKPLIIHGISGSGKTALMANAAKYNSTNNLNSIVISRYIGATPSPSDTRSLLKSLCHQISRIYGVDESDIPNEYNKLIDEFPNRLSLATSFKPLIIFLDALDQLSDSGKTSIFQWFPKFLPENVHIVLSLQSEEYGDMLERKCIDHKSLVLNPMSYNEGEILLDMWLENSSRTLQKQQKKEVLYKFANNGSPLYLKLAFAESIRWHSFTDNENIILSSDISTIILDMFKRLSYGSNHGEMIVSRSLSYLLVSKYGLSEDEMIDILSLDEMVLSDFKKRFPNSKEVDKIPTVIWSRLYFDLEPYLTEINVKNDILLTFYHRQISEAVINEYVNPEFRKKLHLSLANYFASKKFSDNRKIEELPWQLNKAELWVELKDIIKDIEFVVPMSEHRSGIFELFEYWNNLKNQFDLIEEYKISNNFYEKKHESKVNLSKYKASVGLLLQTNGYYEDAKFYLEQALEIDKETLGMDHPNTIINLSRLAKNLSLMGDYEGAEQLYDTSLEISEKIAPKNPHYILTLLELGDLYRKNRDYYKAKQLIEKAFKISQNTLGSNNKLTIKSINSLGVLLRDIGDYTAARKMLNESVEKCKKILGYNSPETATMINNLADLLQEIKDYKNAELLYRESLEINKRVLGSENPNTIIFSSNLGTLLFEKGDKESAEPFYRQSFEISKRVLGSENPTTIICRGNYGRFLRDIGEYDGAIELIEENVEICELKMGKNNYQTYIELICLGFIFLVMENEEDSEKILKEALKIRKKIIDSETNTNVSLSNVSLLLEDIGDYETAEIYLKTALEVHQSMLGMGHPKTFMILERLEKIKNKKIRR